MLPSIWLQQAEVAAQEKEREIADAQRRIAEQECRVDWQLSQLIPSASRLVPECPVCLARLVPPTRIHHCVSGHLVCGACRPRLARCVQCRQRYTGRATAMEQLLRQMLNIA